VFSGINFCQRCGHGLIEKTVDNRQRPCCPSCGYIVFLDPKVAAAVLVLTDGKLVLVRRGTEPAIGRWSYPAGYVDRGEEVEHAAVREVKEETGLDVRLTGLVGLYSNSGDTVVLAAYSAEVTDGKLGAGPEILETGLFSPDELPPMGFPHDCLILSDWRGLSTS
jgi:ADP-ribose pyrophosphatase YjhB (NUDIX family)